jgi:hypothetical protein
LRLHNQPRLENCHTADRHAVRLQNRDPDLAARAARAEIRIWLERRILCAQPVVERLGYVDERRRPVADRSAGIDAQFHRRGIDVGGNARDAIIENERNEDRAAQRRQLSSCPRDLQALVGAIPQHGRRTKGVYPEDPGDVLARWRKRAGQIVNSRPQVAYRRTPGLETWY